MHLRYEEIMSKIINGTIAQITRFSFFTTIVSILENSMTTFCGGSYLGNKTVITSAHCIAYNILELQVFFGLSELNYIHTPYMKNGTRVKAIHIHPLFDPLSLSNDIALLTLDDEPYNISTIRLPDNPFFELPNTSLSILGFGYTSENDYMIEHQLQIGEVIVLDIRNFITTYIDNTMLIAGDPRLNIHSSPSISHGYTDTCKGDSGGPLFKNNENNQDVLVGMTSWGYGCGEEGHPGVYARIYQHVSWIRKMMNMS